MKIRFSAAQQIPVSGRAGAADTGIPQARRREGERERERQRGERERGERKSEREKGERRGREKMCVCGPRTLPRRGAQREAHRARIG